MTTTRQQVEHDLLLRLHRQWDIEHSLLPGNLSDCLYRPQMAFGDLSTSWGYWDREDRRMVFSRRLLEYPWPAFRAVLRHELGHQLADSCLGGTGQCAHGPAFRLACDILHAEPSSCCDHPGYMDTHMHDPENRVIRRIHKLLALAESSNQHEAEAAMSMAHEHMRRYNIQLFAAPEPPPFVSRCLGKPAARHSRHFTALANLLQDHYFVYVIWISCARTPPQRNASILEISGTPENVELAAYVHDFVCHHIERLWADYRGKHNVSGHRKPDYAVGVINGFAEKLRSDAPGNETPKESALLSLADKRLAQYQRRRYPRVTRVRQRAYTDQQIQMHGHAQGRGLVLKRGIREHKGVRGRQLTGKGSLRT